MNSKVEMINELIKTFGYKSYVEIGVYSTNLTFDHINAEKKYGVDPNKLGHGEATHPVPSDTFFAQNKETFDIIFIDGLHHDDQVQRDIQNSVACLNPGGIILVHDCNPMQEIHQRVPMESSYWVGTVWKGWVRMMQSLPPEYEMFVVNWDTGMGVIKATGEGKKLEAIPEEELTFENLELNREKWLNLVSLDYFLNWIKPTKKVTKVVARPPKKTLKIEEVELDDIATPETGITKEILEDGSEQFNIPPNKS